MVKTSSRSHGSRENGHRMTCAAQGTMHTHGQGQHGAKGGCQPSALGLCELPVLGFGFDSQSSLFFHVPTALT